MNNIESIEGSGMWNLLFGWVIVAVVVPLLIAFGWVALSVPNPQFNVAQWAFTVAGAIVAIRLAVWIAAEHSLEAYSRMQITVFSFVVFGSLGCMWVLGLRWVDGLRPAPPKSARSDHADFGLSQRLQDIDEFICKKDEIELRETFDLPTMFKYNIKFAKRNLVPGLISADESANIDTYFLNGRARIDLRYAKVTSVNNRAQIDWLPGKIGVINTSSKYVESRQKLSSMMTSSLLPADVSAALKAFDETLEQNSALMGESLNQSLTADPRSILEDDLYGSYWYGSASGLYWKNFVNLRSKANVVGLAVHQAMDRQLNIPKAQQ